MRVLGVDVGRRRIGLAVSDTSATLARPLSVLTVPGPLEPGVAAVAQEIATFQAEGDGLGAVVVGLPCALDGTPHGETRYVLRFVEGLRQRIALPVHLQDERLSSKEAESLLALQTKDWRRRKAKLDAAAAAVILQDYLDTGRSRESEVGGLEQSE